MKIRLINKGDRNQLICTRADGSTEVADLGPNLPFHDIAHLVIEQALDFEDGFYGNIAKGLSVKQLSDKEIIKTLPIESLVAEILVRALQSLSSGACRLSQFKKLVEEELRGQSIHFDLTLANDEIKAMLKTYEGLLDQWSRLKTGEGLEMVF